MSPSNSKGVVRLRSAESLSECVLIVSIMHIIVFFEDKRHDVFVLQDVLGVERFIDNLLIVNR